VYKPSRNIIFNWYERCGMTVSVVIGAGRTTPLPYTPVVWEESDGKRSQKRFLLDETPKGDK
jgi:hypothetical protein